MLVLRVALEILGLERFAVVHPGVTAMVPTHGRSHRSVIAVGGDAPWNGVRRDMDWTRVAKLWKWRMAIGSRVCYRENTAGIAAAAFPSHRASRALGR